MNNFNQKRKCQDTSDILNVSDVGPIQVIQKKLKKSQKLVIELKMDKKWVGTSQSMHESLTLLSQSQGQNLQDNVQNFLHSSLNQSDFMYLSQFTNQCKVLNHEFDQESNVVKIFLQPKKDFDFQKTYPTPSNIEIKSQGSTNYTENDSTFDQEMSTSCFQIADYSVGQMNEEGL